MADPQTPPRYCVEAAPFADTWIVREKGKRRIALFSRRSEARGYARLLNANDGPIRG